MRNLLSIENPALSAEWSDRNLPLTPEMVTAGSSKKAWWRGACGHEWQAIIKNRAGKGSGCPVCSKNLIVPGENDLLSKAPDIIKLSVVQSGSERERLKRRSGLRKKKSRPLFLDPCE